MSIRSVKAGELSFSSLRLQLGHIGHANIFNTFEATWEVVCVRFSISSSYHPGDRSNSHGCLSIVINATVTGTVVVLLLSSFGQPMMPFLPARTAFLVIFLYACSVSLSPWPPSLTNICKIKIHLLSQPVNRKGGLTLLRPVVLSPGPAWTGHRSEWDPRRWCVLNLSRAAIWGTPRSPWEAKLMKNLVFFWSLSEFL